MDDPIVGVIADLREQVRNLQIENERLVCPCAAELQRQIKATQTAQALADDYLSNLNAVRTRIVAFAGQLQAWGHIDAATGLMDEILIGPVHAPDYDAVVAERDALRWAMDWDTIVGVVQGALCEFGTTARMPDGTPVREHYNALARQILDELEPRWDAVKGTPSTIVEHALAADQWKEQYQNEHKVCAAYRDRYAQDRLVIQHLKEYISRLSRALLRLHRIYIATFIEADAATASLTEARKSQERITQILTTERDDARSAIGAEWERVLSWLIEDTEVRLNDRAERDVAFYNGKLSALTYLRELAVEDMAKALNNIGEGQ